jgi:4-hydroxythreonine-4-phosphate dehydrogenase
MSASSTDANKAPRRGTPPLAFACGDPLGVGPEVSIHAAIELAKKRDKVVLFGDGVALRARIDALSIESSLRARIVIESVGALSIADGGRHEPNAAAGALSLASLDAASSAVTDGRCRALVTAPVSKSAIQLGVVDGPKFTGQTEHLARKAGLASDAVTMMFLGPRLKVALVTTHLSLREVPDAVTGARVGRTIRHLADAVLRLGARPGSRLVVSGLNPHAGEEGMFGDEEGRVIAKAIAWARTFPPFVSGTLRVTGAIGAETAFRDAKAAKVAGVVAMFHDQATIASKLLDWGSAVNVTWGLPYVRTSVDHGVAYDAAAAGNVDASGMIAAARLARALTKVTDAASDTAPLSALPDSETKTVVTPKQATSKTPKR